MQVVILLIVCALQVFALMVLAICYRSVQDELANVRLSSEAWQGAAERSSQQTAAANRDFWELVSDHADEIEFLKEDHADECELLKLERDEARDAAEEFRGLFESWRQSSHDWQESWSDTYERLRALETLPAKKARRK